MKARPQEFQETTTSGSTPSQFDPAQHIIVERREYEALLVRLDHLENELKREKHEPPGERGNHPQDEKRRTFWQWFLQRPAMLLVAVLMVGVLAAGVWGQKGPAAFISGSEYLRKSESWKLGYVTGIADTFSLSKGLRARADLFTKCTWGMTNGQVKAIIDKYLKDNPQSWHKTMASLALWAVIESCEK